MFKKLLSAKVKFVSVLLILIGFILLVLSYFLEPEIWAVQIASIIRGIAITITPIGVITLIFEYFLRVEFLELIKEEISEHKKGFYSDRSKLDFPELFKDTSKVCVLDTSLAFFYAQSQFLAMIEKKAKEGCNSYFLVLDPESVLTQCRASDVGEDVFKDEVKTSISQLCRFAADIKKKKYKGKIEIRKYDSTPTCMLIMTDNKIFIGSVLQQRRGRNSMHVEVTKSEEEGIYKQFHDHFYHIWNDKKTKSVVEEIR